MFNKHKTAQECCDYLNSLGPEPHPETLAGQTMPPAQADWCHKHQSAHRMAHEAGVDDYDYDENTGKWVPLNK